MKGKIKHLLILTLALVFSCEKNYNTKVKTIITGKKSTDLSKLLGYKYIYGVIWLLNKKNIISSMPNLMANDYVFVFLLMKKRTKPA